MSKQKRKPKEPLAFWKKASPEVKSITNHIGKFVDNLKADDIITLAIMGGLAYLGYSRTKTWEGALIGPIGFKLATTMGGTPPVSQIAGLATLGILGLSALPTEVTESIPSIPEAIAELAIITLPEMILFPGRTHEEIMAAAKDISAAQSEWAAQVVVAKERAAIAPDYWAKKAEEARKLREQIGPIRP